MTDEPPIPRELWDQVPPAAQEALRAVLQALEARIAVLEERMGQNSSNSSKPPSTDPPQHKRRPPTKPSGKNRGGQPGHARQVRTLVPPEELAETIDCKPGHCHDCGGELGDDPDPIRHQVAEVPEIRPTVIEYRIHRLDCPHCGSANRGVLPDGVPQTAFGPRLHAILSVLSGAYRLSKRQVVGLGSDLLGLSISIGMVAKLERITAEVLQTPVAELAEQVPAAAVVHIDETGWRQRRQRVWLWVVVCAAGIVFRIARSRSGAVARELLGEEPRPIIISDRFAGYEWIKLSSRQICWAHLRRDFQAMVDRGGEGVEAGEQLLRRSKALFRYWHQVRDGTLERTEFLRKLVWLRGLIEVSLERGSQCGCAKTAATCTALLRLGECLWTFTRVKGVEPTNNAAERALRHAVIWRRNSGGTDSEGGSRFVERMLTTVASCRHQGRDVLAYLTACHRARLLDQVIPSLIPIRVEVQAA